MFFSYATNWYNLAPSKIVVSRTNSYVHHFPIALITTLYDLVRPSTYPFIHLGTKDLRSNRDWKHLYFDPNCKCMFGNGVFHGRKNDSTPNRSDEINYYNELDFILLFPMIITGENISCSEWLPQISIQIYILEPPYSKILKNCSKPPETPKINSKIPKSES